MARKRVEAKAWQWRRLLSVMNGYSPKMKIHPAAYLYRLLRDSQPDLDYQKLENLIVAIWTK